MSNILEEPYFQEEVRHAMKTLSIAALASDDNKVVLSYRYKGIRFKAVCEEDTDVPSEP